MQSIKDSARPVRQTDREEDLFLGTTDESKALNAKGPKLGPSTSKKNKSDDLNNEQEETAPKKKGKDGRQPYTNNAQYISHDKYNTVPGENSTEKKKAYAKETMSLGTQVV